MTKVLEKGFTPTVMAMTILFVGYMMVAGITNLAIGIAIIYVALACFYTGYKSGVRKERR